MRVSLPIPYKVWILVLVPLFLQLTFVAVLVSLLHQIEVERKQERQAREVENHLTALLRVSLTSGNVAMQSQLAHGTTAIAAMKSGAQLADNETDALRELIRNHPHQQSMFSELELQFRHFRESLTAIEEDLKAGNALAVISEGRSLKRRIDKSIVSTNQILSEQQSNLEAAKSAQEAYRKRIEVLLIVGVTLNILIALFFAVYFHRGIVHRLKALMDNTVRLSRGQALTPIIAGDDEIALLDNVFRHMAISVDEMTRRERAIVEHSADLICSIDRQGNFTAINLAIERICGYAPVDLLGRSLSEIVVEQEPTVRALQQLVKEKSEASFENQIRHKDGTFVDMLWSAKWSQDEESLFCIARDITGRKELERLKRDFVAMVSHDLRTPVTTIQMFLDVAAAGAYGELTAADSDDISVARDSVVQLTSLVNNVLDMEKIESGQFTLYCEITSLNFLLNRALSLTALLAEQRSIKIDFIAAPVLSISVDGDRLIWVLTTLLANAIKFSDPGSTISLRAKTGVDWLRIEITDQASEIPENLRESIFDRFAPLGAVKQWQEPSTRIGLAICHAIVEKHGGKMGVESNDERGNRFWFLIPVSPD